MSDKITYTPNPNFPHRYIRPEKLFLYLQRNFSSYVSEVGRSVLDMPIYKLSLGSGSVRVIAWSQMHGNESTGTHAMLDLLEVFKNQPELQHKLEEQMTLDFIFMLNPDGSAQWTRRNALDIDMNRDFLKLSSKEFPILKQIVENGSYSYGLNLHDQRSIFTTNGIHPATLSFLAPSVNYTRDITETRQKAMAVISEIYSKLKPLLPNGIARYTDEFYPTSTGDNFTKWGLPTILFEGGHYPEDYQRKETRKYFTLALYEALQGIALLQGSTTGWEKYLEIPLNKETHYDIIYRNVKLNMDFQCIVDIAVQYREEIREGDDDISFVPIVMEVGDVGAKKGWKEYDCTGKTFISQHKFPKLDSEVDFVIE